MTENHRSPIDGHASCTSVLVAHADGTLACEDAARCGADELLHDWWMPCDELGCACVGDEHLPPLLAA